MIYEGSIEQGWFMDGKLHGKARKILANLDTIEGEYKNGKLDGKGSYYNNQNGFLYNGDFFKGNRHGFGKAKWANGDTYEGNYKFGKCSGFGKRVWANGPNSGDSYEGEWLNDFRHGKGVYLY
jgi:hypothetical protein